jgi:DUF4097 and DUF4098 domain-containing protein YvlB
MSAARKLLKTKIFLMILLAGTLALADESTLERSFSFGGGQLFIDTDRGHVEVRTGSGSDVHVRVSVSRGDLADYLELSFDESNGLRIEGRKVRGGRDGGVRFEIEAPRAMDLRVRTDGGHVEIDDVDGEVILETGGGHISFEDVGGPLEVETGGGHIRGGSIKGTAALRTGGGHIEIGDADDDVEINTSGGHISVGEVNGELFAKSSGGHIRADRVTGNMELRTAGGHVRAKGCQGDAEVNTAGGEIELLDMEGYVHADTGGGDILVSLASGNRSGAELRSGDDGDITLELPAGSGYDIDARASGKVETDLAFQGKRSEDSLRGSLEGGGSEIILRADDGDIHIRTGGR